MKSFNDHTRLVNGRLNFLAGSSKILTNHCTPHNELITVGECWNSVVVSILKMNGSLCPCESRLIISAERNLESILDPRRASIDIFRHLEREIATNPGFCVVVNFSCARF